MKDGSPRYSSWQQGERFVSFKIWTKKETGTIIAFFWVLWPCKVSANSRYIVFESLQLLYVYNLQLSLKFSHCVRPLNVAYWLTLTVTETTSRSRVKTPIHYWSGMWTIKKKYLYNQVQKTDHVDLSHPFLEVLSMVQILYGCCHQKPGEKCKGQ